MPTNIKEKGLETLIIEWLVDNNGYEQGTNEDYDKEFAIDTGQLFRFLAHPQLEMVKQLDSPIIHRSKNGCRTWCSV